MAAGNHPSERHRGAAERSRTTAEQRSSSEVNAPMRKAMSKPMSTPDQTDRVIHLAQSLDLCQPAPYSKAEYARRLLWECVQRTVFNLLPGRVAWWRRFWLRLFGAKLHRTSYIRPGVVVRHPWLFEVGAWTTIGDGVHVYNLGPIRVGHHCIVSQHVHLCNGSHDYTDPGLPLLRPSMTIGSGVWICADAFIGPGVTIGDNTVVGARSVAMRSIPSGVIASGNPATVLRDRPTPAGKVAAPIY